jgi:hypothetical protein
MGLYSLPTRYPYTDKRKILIYKEIEKGAVAKSFITNSHLINDNNLRISSYIRKPFFI